jgi:predicted dehydrogenase
MTGSTAIRWGIIGTANIVRGQFLPGLREAGGGRAVVVGGRDLERARTWAGEHGVERAIAGYQAVIDSADVDAVYVALPNSLHGEWTTRALEAGKAVLCEKPLCVGAAETASVVEAARVSGSLLWEAFVFPFQAQHARVIDLLADGAVGPVSEIVSYFHFQVSHPGNIRLSGALAGGAIADVGCYPVRFAQEVLGPAPEDCHVIGTSSGNGEVETEAVGIVGWGGGRLVVGCGFHRAYDTFTRVLGPTGQLHLTNPFHPVPSDTLTLQRPGQTTLTEKPTTDEHSFTAALRHIHRVLGGEEEPRHLAVDDSLPTAKVLDALTEACRRAG